mmetsp:Transcript_53551/g.148505  ORF Transcript_53551/g.148505 Transcript_53551/m.148505 type:complete len:201 (+) Transcript_53551:471-1073(+)
MMMREVRELARVSGHCERQLLPVPRRAVHERAAHDVARNAVPREALDVRAEDGRDPVPLVLHPMHQDVLNHKVPEGMPAQLRCTDKHFVHQTRSLPTGAMFNEPLEYTATVSVPRSPNCVALQLRKHELHAVCRHELDALLKNVVRVGRGARLSDMALEPLSQGYALRRLRDLERLLNHTATSLCGCQRPHAPCDLLQEC